jgi:hypothetical protein
VVSGFPSCRLGGVLVAFPLNVIFKVVSAFTRVQNVGDFVLGCAVRGGGWMHWGSCWVGETRGGRHGILGEGITSRGVDPGGTRDLISSERFGKGPISFGRAFWMVSSS